MNQPVRYALNGADLVYFPRIFSLGESNRLLLQLKDTIRWQEQSLQLFGKTIAMPRLIAWYADPGIVYRYSGQVSEHNHWTPLLLDIKTRIESLTHCRFNGALLNYYRDGQDSISWHSDDEPELGVNPGIASLSLGAIRIFKLRRRDKTQSFDIPLENGSLLLMQGSTQHDWQHQIAKTRKAILPRLNITFRYLHHQTQPKIL